MSKPTFRRIVAYIIDLLIVSLISAAIATLPMFKTQYKKYEDSTNKYYDLLEEVRKDPTKASALLNDDTMQAAIYETNKSGVFISIITVVVSILYFVVFQYKTNGKTGGKALLKIEVAASDDKRLKLSHIVIRSLIVNRLLSSTIGILTICFLSKSAYISFNSYFEVIELGVMLLTFGMILYNENGQGLHDKLAHTQVILSEEREYFYKHNKKVKDAKVVKEEK